MSVRVGDALQPFRFGPVDPAAMVVWSEILRDPNPGLARFALHLAYDFAWGLSVVFASPWWIWRCVTSRTFRAMAKARLVLVPLPPPDPRRRRVLVHGVSVGEVKGAQALVRALKKIRPVLRRRRAAAGDPGPLAPGAVLPLTDAQLFAKGRGYKVEE